MKVGDTKYPAVQLMQQYQYNENMKKPVDGKQSSGPLVTEDKINLSTKSEDMRLAKNVITALPDIREEKVQELKAQIEKGTYKVNSAAIAEKMVQESIIDLFA